jgi:hypothetical protein
MASFIDTFLSNVTAGFDPAVHAESRSVFVTLSLPGIRMDARVKPAHDELM